MNISGFDWDSGNWPKCGKHGVSKMEIEFVFKNSPAIFPDPFESEDRMRAIGKTNDKRYIFVVFQLRKAKKSTPLIRPISARFMHEKEIANYE